MNADRVPPYQVTGPGMLKYFQGGGREFRNLQFQHHCRLLHTSLVVDGVVFAQWVPGYGVTAIFDEHDDDATTEEISSD